MADCYHPYGDPPAHSHYKGQPIQEYPINPNPCNPQPCHPKPNPCDVLPPPIPPVRYVPGMDVQEQLTNMANQVNVCIDRWNKIQGRCYQALNQVVGAAVSNDVYYDESEVKYSENYSAADDAVYELIECRPVDKCGNPIFMRLETAYNAGTAAAREPMSDKSFVSSANAIITARMTEWSGLCMINGNPVSTQPAIPNAYYAGWDDHGRLLILSSDEATIENATRRHIVDIIGPIIPIVQQGKPTEIALNFADERAAIQAIGYKKCNGNKIMFSCGYQNQAGCSVTNTAQMLSDMGVTTAVITCYQTGYGAPDITGFPKTEEQPETQANENGDLLGLTGAMLYLGQLTDQPLMYQMPQNAAFWIVSKRPTHGWNNKFTGEIADIVQRLGSNANDLQSVQGKLDLDQVTLLSLEKRVSSLETNDTTQDSNIKQNTDDIEQNKKDIEELQETVQTHSEQIATLQEDVENLDKRVTVNEENIADLQSRVSTNETNIEDLQGRVSVNETNITNLQNRTTVLETDTATLKTRVTSLENEFIKLATEVTEEIAARNEADINLRNAITSETTARQLALLQFQK